MPSRMLSNSARSSQNIASTPSALAISSISGADTGAASRRAASGPRIPEIAGRCITQLSTSRKNAVLNGTEIAVAISPPHRNAATSRNRFSRSRRSRNQSSRTAGMLSSVDSASARRNTGVASGRMEAIVPRWARKAKNRSANRPAQIRAHATGRRSGEPIRSRSWTGSAESGLSPAVLIDSVAVLIRSNLLKLR